MTQESPKFALYSLTGEPMSWAELHARNEAWRERLYDSEMPSGLEMSYRAITRTIRITPAGREHLASMRAEVGRG